MTSRTKIVQAVAGSLLLLSTLTVAEGGSSKGPVRDISFSAGEETVCQLGEQRFVLEDLRDLHVCIVFSGLTGTHSADLTFHSPDGHIYQTQTLAFVTPDASATGATVEVKGRHRAVKQAGWRGRGETVVVATLPVAGTYITQYNLAGRWTVKVSLNGHPVDEETFRLEARPQLRRGRP